MKTRSSRISSSISRALLRHYLTRSFPHDFPQRLSAFFALFHLLLARYRPADFLSLRLEAWHLSDEEYLASFAPPTHEAPQDEAATEEQQLIAIGDLGYSGSAFFATPNGKYLVKSLPRRFEHRFFTRDLLDPYLAHMKACPESLLVRIADVLFTPYPTLGGILGAAPTHHIIMENLLFGRSATASDGTSGEGGDGWETYDLKPSSYFFPEWDIADGALVPDSVLDRLVDVFPGKVTVSTALKRQLLGMLDADTRLLASQLAVDYSLFLLRFPGPAVRGTRQSTVPCVSSRANTWRTGADDVEGQWTYRAVVLDFFWAKHKLQARAMTWLVDAFNVVAKKGPMSITTDPGEYRGRFMKMVDELVVGQDDAGG